MKIFSTQNNKQKRIPRLLIGMLTTKLWQLHQKYENISTIYT